ncbi:MAG: hypothetical protein AAF709_08915, partial [Pseudomonadota bacterium]
MRRLVLFVFLLVSPLAAHADPEIVVTQTAERVDVSITGLAPEATYWVTIVPKELELGGYTTFQYLTGSDQATASFDQPDTGQAFEVRLHERSQENTLLASAPLPSPETETASYADSRTRAFAQTYGLSGNWTGKLVCGKGTGQFEVTLRPHFYEDGYLGDLHLTLMDGPGQGATGVWPLTVKYTPDTRGIVLTPDSPLSVPIDGYTIPQIFGTSLSEDGMRVENADVQSHDCTDFSFERVPLPPQEETLATAEALKADGVLGQWQGQYNCGAETALDLSIDVSPLNGLTLARWNYQGPGARAFDGEIEYVVEPSGPGQINLTPLKWIKHPSRHQAPPVTFNIAPDGAAMQGEIAQCGPVAVNRTGGGNTAPAVVLNEAELGALAEYAGRWGGLVQCTGTEHYVELVLPDLTAGNTAAELRYIASQGIDTTTHIVLEAEAHDPIRLKFVQQRSGKANQDPYLPTELDLQDSVLNLQLGETCETAALRPVKVAPTITALPGASVQATLLLAAPGTDTAYVAPPEQICERLAEWAGTLSPSEAQMTRAGRRVLDYGGWPVLFTQRYFEPVFGMDYDLLSASPSVGSALINPLRRSCRDLGVDNTHLRAALSLAFGVERNSDTFGSPAQRFRIAIEKAQNEDATYVALADEIAELPASASADQLANLRSRTEGLEVLEKEKSDLIARLDAKALQAAEREADVFLSALAEGRASPSLQNLLRAAEILQGRDSQTRTQWVGRLDEVALELATDIGIQSEQSPETLGGLEIFPPIAAALAQAEENRRVAVAEASLVIEKRLAETNRIADLRPVLNDIQQQGNSPHLLALYDQTAREVLSNAVNALPPTDRSAIEPALSEGSLAGLRQNALITAFLTGDRVTP